MSDDKDFENNANDISKYMPAGSWKDSLTKKR